MSAQSFSNHRFFEPTEAARYTEGQASSQSELSARFDSGVRSAPDAEAGMVSEAISERVTRDLSARGGERTAILVPHVNTAPQSGDRTLEVTAGDWQEAEAKAAICREFRRLTAEDFSLRQAAAAVGKSPSWFSGPESPLAKFERGGVAGLLPQRRAAGAPITFDVPDWFIAAANHFYLLTNRTENGGSVPEAVRRTISLPNIPPGWQNRQIGRLLKAMGLQALPICPPELREQILAREKAGQPLVTERIARQITARTAIVRQHRHPTNAALDYLCAPGSMFFIHDSKTGERRPPMVGEVIEADDATINFPVCVPWTLGGDACSDRYGVKVGRFQWLVSIDVARGFVTAYSYTMRPRGSYRGEDALALVRGHCLQHGKPKRAHFEQGVWKSNLVKEALKAAGIELHTVWSPHQKPHIEGLFNTLWTKLSVHFPDAHVGRFRGENEAANDLLVACQRGSRDPRRHFPMLADAIAAFDSAVAEKNQTPVNSAIGRWIPAEAWASRQPGDRLDAETEWLFAPWQRTWTVRGMLVGGRVPLFDDLSVSFDFSADWLANYHGAKVRCHFDPTAPRCHAMLVLSEAFGGEPAGKVLGLAQQINEVAGYARLVLGWGDDPANAGRLARQRAAAALRREVRAIVPGGHGYAASEERDGVSQVSAITKIPAGPAPARDEIPTNPPRERGSAGSARPPASAAPTPSVDRAAQRAALEAFEREHAHLFT
jgi:hypothetical protein